MNEYSELVEKLAKEIVDGVAESMEKEAGVKEVAKKTGMSFMDIIKAKQAKAGMAAGKAVKSVKANPVKSVAAAGAATAVPAGIAAALMMKKKKEAATEKAASILYESQLQKIAAEEAFEEAQLGEDASIRVLEEMGIDPQELLDYMMSEEETEEGSGDVTE